MQLGAPLAEEHLLYMEKLVVVGNIYLFVTRF